MALTKATNDVLAIDSVKAAQIEALSVDTAELADDSVTAAKIDDGAVGSAAIGTGAVDTDELATDAVTTVKILDANVTRAKLAGALGFLDVTEMIHVRDEKANTTTGGTFTQDAWQVRELNTVVTNTIAGASLNDVAWRVTLPAGDYLVVSSAPAHSVNNHKAKLWNKTDSTDIIIGDNAAASNGASTMTRSHVFGLFTLAAEKTLELRHYCQVTNANGFGQPASFGVIEVYADAVFYKVG